MYADELLLPWLRRLTERLPGVQLTDAHTHLGSKDPDGWGCSPAELTGALTLAGARAVVFPLMERAGYREANDAVLAAAAVSGGRLVPFCRVNPHSDPVRELQRCLDGGARGVKLHPRAERFDLRHPGVAAVFAAAAERRLPVIIHAGLGIPSLGRGALMLGERYPGAPLILAHLGVTDLGWIWRRLEEHPSLFFDTAWWNPADHLALFAHVPPGRILLGSDTPYGTPAAAAIVAIRCALHAGLTATQIQAVTGGQLQRLLTADDPADLGSAPGPPPPRPPLLDRVFTLLIAALARMLDGQPATGLLQLARLGCQTGPHTPHAPLLSQISELLDHQQRYAQTIHLDGRRTAGFHLVLTAAALAATPSVGGEEGQELSALARAGVLDRGEPPEVGHGEQDSTGPDALFCGQVLSGLEVAEHRLERGLVGAGERAGLRRVEQGGEQGGGAAGDRGAGGWKGWRRGRSRAPGERGGELGGIHRVHPRAVHGGPQQLRRPHCRPRQLSYPEATAPVRRHEKRQARPPREGRLHW